MYKGKMEVEMKCAISCPATSNVYTAVLCTRLRWSMQFLFVIVRFQWCLCTTKCHLLLTKVTQFWLSSQFLFE